MKKLLYIQVAIIVALAIALSCNSITLSKKPNLKPGEALPIDRIQLPPGFKIAVYAQGIENARSMSLSPEGTLYVGTRAKDKVYAIRDTNADFRADQVFTIASGLNSPNGVAFKDGSLYIAEISRISRLDNIEESLENPPKPVTVYGGYPTEGHHGWKYISFGPDGMLYVPVGAPCNICKSEEPIFASITRMKPDGTGIEIFAHGVRNTVGFSWHPITKELWFTDNGRDWMGDDMPACELNHAPEKDMHFGYPYCHQGDAPDPKFGDLRNCSEFVPPAINLGPHVAPLGMEFYSGDQFPENYRHQILIAEHGSWNRSERIGYRVMMVTLEEGKAKTYQPFAEGWLHNGKPWGRPVDLEHLPDGSVLISDDFADAIYRIFYEG